MGASIDPNHELETTGRIWCRALLSPSDVKDFARLCEVGEKPGIRMGLTPELAEFIGPASTISRYAVRAGMDAAPVRIVSFNKSSGSNWSVPWHQDRVIALAERIETTSFTNWVEKDQIWHCEPPVELLNNLIFIRVHFDGCDEKNGAMEIALGSHRKGLVEARLAKEVAETHEIEVCCAAPGDILIVKALTLHRSGSSASEGSRRALRVDYARRSDLSPRLTWSIPAN